MARKKPTVFQALDNAISGNWKSPVEPAIPHVNKYDMNKPDNTVIYRTSNKEDYLQK